MFKTIIPILGNVVQPDLFVEIFYCRDAADAAADDDAADAADADDDASPTLASKLQHHNASLIGQYLSASQLKPQISSHASCNHASSIFPHFCHYHLRHTPPTARCIAAVCTCPFGIHCNTMRSFGISFPVPSHSRSCF